MQLTQTYCNGGITALTHSVKPTHVHTVYYEDLTMSHCVKSSENYGITECYICLNTGTIIIIIIIIIIINNNNNKNIIICH